MKFQLPPGSRAVLEASAIFSTAEAVQRHEVTTYYDTPDAALNRSGLTLRVRRRGTARIQTVKSRANGSSIAADRGEWEWQIDQEEPDVGLLAAVDVLAQVAQTIDDRLEPVFVTDIRRTTRLLPLTATTAVEVAIDEGFIAAGCAQEPVSEIELELKSGAIGPMYRLAIQLQSLTPMWIAPESKSLRGWHLRTGQTEAARTAQTPDLGRHILAAEGFRQIIDVRLGHLMANIGPTLRGDPEGVHQIRLAIRSCRAALKLFERHLDPAVAGQYDAQLRQFGLIFGAARDWDVFCLQTLPAAMADLPAKRIWDLHPVAAFERQAAHAAAAAALRGPEFTALVLGMAIWVDEGAAQPATLGDRRMDTRLDRLAPSLLNRIAGQAKARSRHAGRLSEENLHRLRKALKKLFYNVESLSGLYGNRAVKAYRHHCRALSALLGVATDSVVTRLLALKLVTERRQDLAEPANALTQWSARRGRRARKKFLAMLPAFRDMPAFWSGRKTRI